MVEAFFILGSLQVEFQHWGCNFLLSPHALSKHHLPELLCGVPIWLKYHVDAKKTLSIKIDAFMHRQSLARPVHALPQTHSDKNPSRGCNIALGATSLWSLVPQNNGKVALVTPL